MAIDRAAVQQALRAWVIAATGLEPGKVIFDQGDGPRPKPPFITLNDRLALARVGLYDEEVLTDTPGEVQHCHRRRLTVSLNAYGPNANGLAELAQEGLCLYSIREQLTAVDLAVIDDGDVRDLGELLGTKHEERAQMDVIFGITSTTSEDVGYIATVDDIAGSFTEWGDPTVTYTETFSVPG